MTNRLIACVVMLMAGVMIVQAEPAKVDDPAGVLKKPIPDKIVVVTFDDGPASLYTVVAPILKSHGFNGSFYVCDFDSFRTRKDWYMTFRQMKELADQGFEIGNHSFGHSPGFDSMMKMEDELLANNVPKPTTIAWPLHHANPTPDFYKAGYIFARGGHNRAYRPTVDNPLEIPSMWCNSLEGFVKMVRQAAGGKIVAICYHGVPDMEHPGVSLDPEVFKVQMQYLKDNNYKVIALRDLVEYIDPVKAAKLPMTARDFKDPGPVVPASEEKPIGTVNIVKPRRDHRPSEDKSLENPSAPAGIVTPLDSSKPNVFTWRAAEAGNWSDGSKWSNNLVSGSAPVAGGQADYVFTFNKSGKYEVMQDLGEGLQLNRLNLETGKGEGLTLNGESLTFTRKSAADVMPAIIQHLPFEKDNITVPLNLASDLRVDGATRSFLRMEGVISGTGALVYNGNGTIFGGPNGNHSTLFMAIRGTNTYSGGTIINGGRIWQFGCKQAFGTGPITMNGGQICYAELTNSLVLNHGVIDGGGASWNAPITLNGIATLNGSINFNDKSGGISGKGGITMEGTWATWSIANCGVVSLYGPNTYTGPTTILQGTVAIKKVASLYNAEMARWTPENITVFNTATLRLNAGGPGEFSGEQISVLLKKLTSAVNSNGMMGGSVLCLDVTTGTVTVAADISDSKGLGGGAFLLKKCGPGTLQLSGRNTYTGQTILENGVLSVSSLNNFVKGKPMSSLGAPTDIEAAEIVMGEEWKDSECTMVYTGKGETSDRVINLAGRNLTVTFDQSGKGLLKLTSTFVISGYGASKTIVLKGDTAGKGEIAGNIVNPHDRAGKATTSVTKSGTGLWTLSGINTYTGPTTVKQGTLTITSAKSLGNMTDVYISGGAVLELGFKGEIRVGKLYIEGKVQSPGKYSAENGSKFIKGKGVLNNQ